MMILNMKRDSLALFLPFFQENPSWSEAKMDPPVKIIKCNFCESFSTTSTDTFLRHLRDHKCELCKKYHRSKGWKAFCRRAKRYPVTINCCFPRCHMKYSNVTEFQKHLSEYHGKCVICNKYTCQCYFSKLRIVTYLYLFFVICQKKCSFIDFV